MAVVGSGTPGPDLAVLAQETGAALGAAGAVVVCGGLGGVMEAAARGARASGGLTVGLLPGRERAEGNPWLDVALPTGLGEARNALVVRAADALVAIGGGYGTLSEIALALKAGVPVVGLGTWDLAAAGGPPDAVIAAASAAEAAERALRLAAGA